MSGLGGAARLMKMLQKVDGDETERVFGHQIELNNSLNTKCMGKKLF